MDVTSLSETMLTECQSMGQSARRVPDSMVDEMRAALRADARERRLRVRTARMDDVVVVARLDADLCVDGT